MSDEYYDYRHKDTKRKYWLLKNEIKKQKTDLILIGWCRELGNPPSTLEPLIIA